MMESTFVIAEAGVNHNGSLDMAFQLIDAAVGAGADAVKFQTFKTENLVTKSASKASYQKCVNDPAETQFSMLKELELTYLEHYELKIYCEDKKIMFLSTAFDLESLDFLEKELNLNLLKIPSGEITNGPLLLAYARTGCDLILSTGMATMREIEDALSVIAFGLLYGNDSHEMPSREVFNDSYSSLEGKELLSEKVTLLHCTTEYPAALVDINLKAMQTMHKDFGLNVGYSDHSEGTMVPVVAVALGATIVEKHFTLDKKFVGPDHKASLNPDELTEMIESIRAVEKILGNGIKEPAHSEIKNIPIVRKSIVAAKPIMADEVFTDDNLAIKRPGTGVSPMKYWEKIGSISRYSYCEDESIQE